MIRGARGASLVEYVVLVVLVVALVGGALLGIASSLYAILNKTYVNIGS